jgi:hypothetical protein
MTPKQLPKKQLRYSRNPSLNLNPNLNRSLSRSLNRSPNLNLSRRTRTGNVATGRCSRNAFVKGLRLIRGDNHGRG